MLSILIRVCVPWGLLWKLFVIFIPNHLILLCQTLDLSYRSSQNWKSELLVQTLDLSCLMPSASNWKKRNGELKQICYTLMSQCDWNCMNVAFHRFKGSEAWLWLCRPLAAMDGYFKPTNIQYHGVSWPIRSWSDDIMSGCVPYIMHCINTSSRAQ